MQHGKGVAKAMNNFFDSQASSYGKSLRNNFHSEGRHCGVSGVDLIGVRRGEYALQLDKSRPSTVYTKHMKRRDSLKGHSMQKSKPSLTRRLCLCTRRGACPTSADHSSRLSLS
jgi:hypothetical protein